MISHDDRARPGTLRQPWGRCGELRRSHGGYMVNQSEAIWIDGQPSTHGEMMRHLGLGFMTLPTLVR